MKLDCSVNLDGIYKRLDGLAKEQIPRAAAYALTGVAMDAKEAIQKEMERKFDRPTKFTLNSIRVQPARERDFGTSRFLAEVKIQDTVRDSSNRPVSWLYPGVEGGKRNLKGLEVLLQARGMMPRGWYAVPTDALPKDAYGNVGAGTINKILSQLRARNDYNLDKNETADAKAKRNSKAYRGKRVLSRYFAIMPGQRLPPGIWERLNTGAFMGPVQRAHGSIRPVFLYVRAAPVYKSRVDFDGIVQRVIKARLEQKFRRGFLEAQRGAKTK